MHGGALTIPPGVGSHGPILQPCKQVLGAVPQAEDRLHAWAFAGQQALRPRVHAAVDHDAGEGTGKRWGDARDHTGPHGLVLVIASKGWLRNMRAHLPSRNPKHTVGCGDAGGCSVVARGSWVPVGSPSPASGIYSMHSTGEATGKDLTVRGTARLREKISTCPPAPSWPPPTCGDQKMGVSTSREHWRGGL